MVALDCEASLDLMRHRLTRCGTIGIYQQDTAYNHHLGHIRLEEVTLYQSMRLTTNYVLHTYNYTLDDYTHEHRRPRVLAIGFHLESGMPRTDNGQPTTLYLLLVFATIMRLIKLWRE